MTNSEVKEFKKDYIIYKVSKWNNANGDWCKITYAFKYNATTVSQQTSITTEWLGCRWASLYAYLN